MQRTWSTSLIISSVSVFGAIALLAILLVVASSPDGDRMRRLDAQLGYLLSALDTMEQGLAASSQNNVVLDTELKTLDRALDEGSAALQGSALAIYAPAGILGQLRRPMMAWINSIDSAAGTLNAEEVMLAAYEDAAVDIERVRTQLFEHNDAALALQDTYQNFERTATQVVAEVRELGQDTRADSIYVATERIKDTLQGDVSQNAMFGLIDRLDAAAKGADAGVQEQVRRLSESTYAMLALRRTMSQALGLMQLGDAKVHLSGARTLSRADAVYVSVAISDARVLLNIYTVLMLVIVAGFGLRLRASHVALNRSHDDLEARVVERTADLAQANENLKESQVQLVQAEKMSSLGQLVAGVMHEINTPLLYVLNNTTTTAQTVGELNEYVQATLPLLKGGAAVSRLPADLNFDAEDLAEGIAEVQTLSQDSIDGLQQISELVQSLKDFSRLDRASDDLFDVREGIEKTLTITHNLLKYGVTVEKTLGDVPPIQCSPSRVNQVFINLVTNAAQAMDGKGTLKISTQHLVNSVQESVEIVFEDTGCGIPQEYLNKVMDPFFTTKPVGQGTGLGLSIVRQIVDQHGGQILIDSREGVGTRITLNFPVGGKPATRPDSEEAA